MQRKEKEGKLKRDLKLINYFYILLYFKNFVFYLTLIYINK